MTTMMLDPTMSMAACPYCAAQVTWHCPQEFHDHVTACLTIEDGIVRELIEKKKWSGRAV